jgi:hypothetical protein
VPLWYYESKPWEQPTIFIDRAASVVQMSSSTFYHWVSECMVRLAFLLPMLQKERVEAIRRGNIEIALASEKGAEGTTHMLLGHTEPLVLLVPSYFRIWPLATETMQIVGIEWEERAYPPGRAEATAATLRAAEAAAAGKLLVFPYDGSSVVAAGELTYANWAPTDSRPGQEFLPPRLGLVIVRALVHSRVLADGMFGKGTGTGVVEGGEGEGVAEMVARMSDEGRTSGRTSGTARSGSGDLLVYISRTNTTAARRSLRNEAAVLVALEEEWGGHSVHHSEYAKHPEESGRRVVVFDGKGVTLAEQVALFGRASAVFGTHGSALANIAFCTAGTAVVEFSLPSPNLRMFMHTAAALDLAYWMLPATPAEAEKGGSGTFEGEIEVPIEDVKHVLRAIYQAGTARNDRD